MTRHHVDAVDWTRREAQFTARAVGSENGVQRVRHADDRIDGTRARAQIAANALALVDARHSLQARGAAARIERHCVAPE
jgi:hypothetical protein